MRLPIAATNRLSLRATRRYFVCSPSYSSSVRRQPDGTRYRTRKPFGWGKPTLGNGTPNCSRRAFASPLRRERVRVRVRGRQTNARKRDRPRSSLITRVDWRDVRCPCFLFQPRIARISANGCVPALIAPRRGMRLQIAATNRLSLRRTPRALHRFIFVIVVVVVLVLSLPGRQTVFVLVPQQLLASIRVIRGALVFFFNREQHDCDSRRDEFNHVAPGVLPVSICVITH